MQTRELTLINREGKRMPATLRTPEGTPKGTALVLHGLGGWKGLRLLEIIAETLCKDGYYALTFDASDASTSPDGDFFLSSTSKYLEDIEDVVSWMRSQEWCVTPLTLVGHSAGGFAAFWFTVRNPSIISKLVMVAPAVSWNLCWYRWFIPGAFWLMRGKLNIPGPSKYYFVSKNWLLDFLHFDVLKGARHVMVPLLVISAAHDWVATPRMHEKLARTVAHGTHHVVRGIKGLAHNHLFWGHEQEVADTITTWLTSS